jgi:hypothetical protein
MSSMEADDDYAGGLSGAINDATDAGHSILYLTVGSEWASDTVTAADGTRGPGTAVPRLTIRPANNAGPMSVSVDDLTLDGAEYLRFHNIHFGDRIRVPEERTLPIFDTASPCENAGIKLTPVVDDLPIPRVRVLNHSPKLANQVENLVVTVDGRDITVSGLGTDSNKKVTTTALSIINAINLEVFSANLVTAAVKDGQDGSGHVQDGFPFWEVCGSGWRACDLEDFTGNVSFVACTMGQVALREGCHDVNVKRCFFPESSFPLTYSLNDGDKKVRDVRFDDNYCYGGYNTDCMGPRPAEFDGFYMRRNIFETGIDPEASSIHADTFQPINGGRLAVIQRNKFIHQSGQCVFINNFLYHKLLFENNLVHQNGEANLSCRFGGVKSGIVRHNTFIVDGLIWDEGDAGDNSERLDSMRCYHNITTRFSRITGNPIQADYNIVETPGTGWVTTANETAVLPEFVSENDPEWDYHYLDGDQPGVGDGNTEPTFNSCFPIFMGAREPTVDLDGNARNPASVDLGCYVA